MHEVIILRFCVIPCNCNQKKRAKKPFADYKSLFRQQCLQLISCQTGSVTTSWFYVPTVHDYPYHENF